MWQYFIHSLLPRSLQCRSLWSLIHISPTSKSATFSLQSRLEVRRVASSLSKRGERQSKCKLKTSSAEILCSCSSNNSKCRCRLRGRQGFIAHRFAPCNTHSSPHSNTRSPWPPPPPPHPPGVTDMHTDPPLALCTSCPQHTPAKAAGRKARGAGHSTGSWWREEPRPPRCSCDALLPISHNSLPQIALHGISPGMEDEWCLKSKCWRLQGSQG